MWYIAVIFEDANANLIFFSKRTELWAQHWAGTAGSEHHWYGSTDRAQQV